MPLLRPARELCACGRPKSQVATTCWECRKRQVVRRCVVCGEEFSAKRSKQQQCCGPECAYRLRGRNSRTTQSRKVAVACEVCGAVRLYPPSRASRRFCSSS